MTTTLLVLQTDFNGFENRRGALMDDGSNKHSSGAEQNNELRPGVSRYTSHYRDWTTTLGERLKQFLNDENKKLYRWPAWWMLRVSLMVTIKETIKVIGIV